VCLLQSARFRGDVARLVRLKRPVRR
jgi:hypothetical protein